METQASEVSYFIYLISSYHRQYRWAPEGLQAALMMVISHYFCNILSQRCFLMQAKLSTVMPEKPDCRGSCHLCTCSSPFCANRDACTEVSFQCKRTQVVRYHASWSVSVCVGAIVFFFIMEHVAVWQRLDVRWLSFRGKIKLWSDRNRLNRVGQVNARNGDNPARYQETFGW